ncbi:hypothetical protein C8R46DRAFT_1125757 [Mycena filopes]|nr:hypothetical protein C8R46DRAFT_1125757 [Mycena filopes]
MLLNVNLFTLACLNLLGLAAAVPLSGVDVAARDLHIVKRGTGAIWANEEEPTGVENIKRGTGAIWANEEEPTSAEGANTKRGTGIIWANADEPTSADAELPVKRGKGIIWANAEEPTGVEETGETA